MSKEALALLEDRAGAEGRPFRARDKAISLLEQRAGVSDSRGPVEPGGRRGRGRPDQAAAASVERKRREDMAPADPYVAGGSMWSGQNPSAVANEALLNIAANVPSGIAGFAGETVGRVQRLFDSGVDPFEIRDRFAAPLSVAPSAEVAEFMRPIGEAADRGAEWLEKQHPALQAAATTARYGSELLGAAGAVRGAIRGAARGATDAPRGLSRQNMGAAAVDIDLDRLSPGLRAEVEGASATGPINRAALDRQIDADTLPIPMRISEGQATGDPSKIAEEINKRGLTPERGKFFQEQNQQLIENLDEIRRQAGPDVVHRDHIQNGQALIDSYKNYDARVTADIDAKYQALRDAAGGEWPVDAKSLYEGIQQKLKKELLSREAPASQLAEIAELADAGSMTFEQFLSLRRNLGNIARTASDGNTRQAASIMVDQLENLPLKGPAADLKPLADAARSAARERFKALEQDPAYRAAVKDGVELGESSPEADSFVRKYVIGGKAANLQRMRDKFPEDPEVNNTLSMSALNYLRDKARVRGGEGVNFSQAGYNNALRDLEPKMSLLVPEQTAEMAAQLGRVANTVLHQPRGAAVSTSGTAAAMIAEGAKKGAESLLNMKTGAPIGSYLRRKIDSRAEQKAWEEATRPGAGIRETQ